MFGFTCETMRAITEEYEYQIEQERYYQNSRNFILRKFLSMFELSFQYQIEVLHNCNFNQ